MNDLSIDIDFNHTNSQKAAMRCKADISEIYKRLFDVGNNEEDYKEISKLLFAGRAKIIKEIVSKLGNLNEYQVAYVSSLLEYAEFNTQTESCINEWRPSLLTGEWQ